MYRETFVIGLSYEFSIVLLVLGKLNCLLFVGCFSDPPLGLLFCLHFLSSETFIPITGLSFSIFVFLL